MEKIDRRRFVKDSMKITAVAAIGSSLMMKSEEAQAADEALKFSQVALPYAYGALEPNIDAMTMEIHYTKHHTAYIKNVNDAIAAENIKFATEKEFFANASKLSAKARNNGGGAWNHNFFWQVMKAGGGGAPATVFVLGADTGVTRSDMQLWREHLGARAASCFVVLNKIDTLRDPLSAPSQVTNQIESLRRATARTLAIAPERVFAVSAREALTARIHGDDAALRASRLPAFEAALGAQLLGQRHALLQGAVAEAARQLQLQVAHRAGERRRQSAEQVQELRGLRGKSANQLRAAQERAAAEAAEFEQCNVHVQALRAVHLRLLTKALATLASDALRGEVLRMQQEMRDSLLNLGARKAFVALCERLRVRLAAAQSECVELHAMLRASHARLNAQYAFGLSLDAPPTLQLFARELRAIESGYTRYLGLTHALRLSQPRFMEAFVRMLVSKLRVVFESAAAEIELWSKSASSHLDAQLAERRRAFRRRSEALARVRIATGELEQRIAELGAQDAALAAVLQLAGEQIEALPALAPAAPETAAPPAASAQPVAPVTTPVRRPTMPMPKPLGARA